MGELLEAASLAEVSVEATVFGSLRAVGAGAARPILGFIGASRLSGSDRTA